MIRCIFTPTASNLIPRYRLSILQFSCLLARYTHARAHDQRQRKKARKSQHFKYSHGSVWNKHKKLMLLCPARIRRHEDNRKSLLRGTSTSHQVRHLTTEHKERTPQSQQRIKSSLQASACTTARRGFAQSSTNQPEWHIHLLSTS